MRPDLSINCTAESERIEQFIRDCVIREYKKNGVVVGVSGGLDSSVTLALCVRALGAERVRPVALPERQSSDESLLYARSLCEALGCQLIVRDISSALEAFSVYDRTGETVRKYYPAFDDSHSFKLVLPDLLSGPRMNVYSLVVTDADGQEVLRTRLRLEDYNATKAATSMKLRTRMLWLYYQAEKSNSVVAGTTNRSEFELGNFCKYGDGGVDFEVISHLYKGQVYELAAHLGIPDEIISRQPSPDTFSAYVSDQEFFFSLPFDLLDVLLAAHADGSPADAMAEELALDEEQVSSIYANFEVKRMNTRMIKQLPPSLYDAARTCW